MTNHSPLSKTILRISFLILIFLNTSTSVLAIRDVPSGHWASNSVKEVVDDYGFMQGDPNGYFGGNRSLSRYEFAKTLSRLIEYYNGEISADRKDIENIVSVMELFQNELKTLEEKMSKIDQEVEAQNQTISELNEIAISIGEEFSKGKQGNVDEDSDMDMNKVVEARLVQLEYDVHKLSNKGLFIDTLVKGTFNDVKKLGGATSRVFSRTRRNVARRRTIQEEVTNEVVELEKEAIEARDNMSKAVQSSIGEELNTNINIYPSEEYGNIEVLEEVETY